jgi:hypothetical protein
MRRFSRRIHVINERDDPHFAAALRTFQRVYFVNARRHVDRKYSDVPSAVTIREITASSGGCCIKIIKNHIKRYYIL